MIGSKKRERALFFSWLPPVVKRTTRGRHPLLASHSATRWTSSPHRSRISNLRTTSQPRPKRRREPREKSKRLSDGTQSEVAIKTNQTALPSALLPLCYQLYLAVRPSSLSGVVRGAGVKESSLVAPRPKTRDLNNLFVVGASVCISGDGASSAATAQGDGLRR